MLSINPLFTIGERVRFSYKLRGLDWASSVKKPTVGDVGTVRHLSYGAIGCVVEIDGKPDPHSVLGGWFFRSEELESLEFKD